jgi:hypothetical protein
MREADPIPRCVQLLRLTDGLFWLLGCARFMGFMGLRPVYLVYVVDGLRPVCPVYSTYIIGQDLNFGNGFTRYRR